MVVVWVWGLLACGGGEPSEPAMQPPAAVEAPAVDEEGVGCKADNCGHCLDQAKCEAVACTWEDKGQIAWCK